MGRSGRTTPKPHRSWSRGRHRIEGVYAERTPSGRGPPMGALRERYGPVGTEVRTMITRPGGLANRRDAARTGVPVRVHATRLELSRTGTDARSPREMPPPTDGPRGDIRLGLPDAATGHAEVAVTRAATVPASASGSTTRDAQFSGRGSCRRSCLTTSRRVSLTDRARP